MSFEGTIVKLHHWRPSKPRETAYIEFIGIVTKKTVGFHHEVLLMDGSRTNEQTSMIDFRKLKDWELDDRLLETLRFSKYLDIKFDSLDDVKRHIEYLKEAYDVLEKPGIKGHKGTVVVDEGHLFGLDYYIPEFPREPKEPRHRIRRVDGVAHIDDSLFPVGTCGMFYFCERKETKPQPHTKPKFERPPVVWGEASLVTDKDSPIAQVANSNIIDELEKRWKNITHVHSKKP